MTDDRWYDSAACAGQAPAWDIETGRQSEATVLIAICAACPVLTACRDDAFTPGREPRSTVRGGIHWSDAGRPMTPGTPGQVCPCGNAVPNRKNRYCSTACRQAARPLVAIDHGTEAGATAHRRRHQDPCEPCLQAERLAAAERQRRRYRRRVIDLQSRHVCGDCGGALTTLGGARVHARSGRVNTDCPEPVRNVVRRGDYEAGEAA